MLRNVTLALITALLLACSATAQEDYVATTAQDPKIEVEVLKLKLRPLQLAEIEAEANAWQKVLADLSKKISASAVEARTAAEPRKTELTDQIATDREEQTRIVDRYTMVLSKLTALGGDAEPHTNYISSATAVDIDASDVSGTFKFVTTWLTSEEGGIRLGLNIVKFLLTLLAFKILSRILAGIARKAISRMKGATDLLREFFVNTVRNLTFFIGLVIAVSMLGVEVGPFVAAIGAVGFIIAFALQGTLSNFASGIMILIYRPYDVGQVVTVAGTTGKVDAMSLVSTTLRLPDNQTVVVPNNSIWGGVITNITGQATRRVDMKFGVSYTDDLKKVQSLLEEIISKHPKTLAEPAPAVKLHELADSSVNFVARPWVNTADYWDVFWDVTREVKERFDKEGVSIPFPQRDVHVHQVGG